MAMTLTVDDLTPFEVLEDGATERESEEIGGMRRRAWDGTPRSSVQDEKRVFEFSLLEMENVDYLALKEKFKFGAVVPCTTDLFPGTLNCWGKITNAGFLHRDTGFRKAVTIQLIEG